MKVLIVTGGQVDRLFLKNTIEKNNYSKIIGVDKGAEYLYNIGIIPDLLIGDFDSSNKQCLEYYESKNIKIIKYSSDKDMTDTELAINNSINNNENNITIVGGFGSRIDHTLANILILEKYINNASIKLIDKNNIVSLINGKNKIKIEKSNYDYISLISLSNKVEGLTTNGLKYELNNKTLNRFTSLGVSNEIEKEYCNIEINKGTLAIIQSLD